MNIEEAINKIKEVIYMSDGTKVDYIDINHMDLGGEVSVDVFIEAIETLLTAYEKEKNKDMSCDLTETRADHIDESTMLKQIKLKLQEKNIPIETLLAEFERLEDLEDDREMLKAELEKEKEKNKEILLGNIENFQKYFLEEFNKKFISKDKLKEMLNGYKKALKDVEEAISILKSNLLVVADEKHKKEIEKELTFREEDRISKISIINLLEDLLEEE